MLNSCAIFQWTSNLKHQFPNSNRNRVFRPSFLTAFDPFVYYFRDLSAKRKLNFSNFEISFTKWPLRSTVSHSFAQFFKIEIFSCCTAFDSRMSFGNGITTPKYECKFLIICKLEIKSPYTLLKLSYLEIREAEIKNFLHEYCQTLFLLIGRNKFAIGHFGQ